jgi:hypothetical protein
MTARALIGALCARDVRLTAASGRLQVDAPAGALTAADREVLAQNKSALLALLDARCLDCGAALPLGNLYRCPPCTAAAWRRIYGSAPPTEDGDTQPDPQQGLLPPPVTTTPTPPTPATTTKPRSEVCAR